jgi:hypothetical protein
LISVISLMHVIFIEFFYRHDAAIIPGYKIFLIEMADFALLSFLVMWLNKRLSRPN